MGRTSTTTQARRVARDRLAGKLQQRREREHRELEHLVEFETAREHRARAETEMAAAVTALIDLGNSVVEVAELTGQAGTEIRRLRKLAPPTSTPIAPLPEPPARAAEGLAAGVQVPWPAGTAEPGGDTDVPTRAAGVRQDGVS